MPDEDVWCIDNRGVLTLSVSGDTYQTLGLVGKRVSFGKGKAKEGDGRHVITLPLQPHTESEKNRERRNNSLKRLEERRRRQQALSKDGSVWRVLCSSAEEEKFSKFIDEQFNESEVILKDINCETFHQENVKIPIVQIVERPKPQSLELDGQSRMEDQMEDHEESIEQLLEWIGMAGLNSQRLQANDRVDPFVAVYEAPSPNTIGALTHFKWTGLLSPAFVQSVIDCVMKQLHSQASGSRDPQFVSIVGHACTWSPVCYIPPSLLDSPECTPIRDPSKDEEDTWCLVVTSGSSARQRREEPGCWLLAESAGKHDKRWG
ncbi:hypothetical protein E1B28_007377 [Marasmius oreades]|uniref:Uncharacterized protein n=1 Tax=Marasmius oreades TaxID=181124 RepID=A0A9P7UTZ1_9AGAR|nr:uncharacterized protein E1B28_007377 [Marasmius oreades]KAG7093725.1 hypothetical protein E1B28_007377 [Marasmius oreades]